MSTRCSTPARMVVACLAMLLTGAAPVLAQDPPPPLPRFVIDVHGATLSFPDRSALADSRGLTAAELPGRGFGGRIGAHVYPVRWRAITFGVGGEFMVAHAHSTPDPTATTLRPVSERFLSLAPQLSLNFGTGDGWSYLSGGVSRSSWSIVPDGAAYRPVDDERLTTFNYGGGARWFAKPHVAFSFDVRFYAIPPSTTGVLGPSPRTLLVLVGAGVSLK